MTKTMMKTTMLSLVAALGLVATGARADDSKTSSDSNAVTSDTMNANKKDDLDRMAKKKNKDAAKPSSADPSAAPQGVTGSSATSPATSPATPPPADSTSPSSTPPPAPPK
jgi:hypothetical protein